MLRHRFITETLPISIKIFGARRNMLDASGKR